MASLKKIVQKLKNNPTSVSYVELERILLDLGFEKVHQGSSHIKFRKSDFPRPIVISRHGKDCSENQKKFLLKTLNFYKLI